MDSASLNARAPLQAILHPQAATHRFWLELKRHLGEVECLTSRYPGHARLLACQSTASTVLAVGGDGTVHQVVNGLMARADAPRLGIVPLGSGNDIARSLSVPRQPTSLAAQLLDPASKLLDLLQVEFPGQPPLYALGFVGVGFSSHAVSLAHRLRGKLPNRLLYLAALLVGMASWRNVRMGATPDYSADIMNFNIANLKYYGGGMIGSPVAEPQDGRFECVGMALSRLAALRNLHHTYTGQFHKVAGVTQWSASDTEVDAPGILQVQADGELVGTTPFRCRLLAGALTCTGQLSGREPGQERR